MRAAGAAPSERDFSPRPRTSTDSDAAAPDDDGALDVARAVAARTPGCSIVAVDAVPRFPLAPGWQTHFTFGYKVPKQSFVKQDPKTGAKSVVMDVLPAVKGIYIKSANRAHPDPQATAEITDILYENVTMEAPEQVPIWIGPAQEGDSANACSLFWPELPGSKCPAPLGTVQ